VREDAGQWRLASKEINGIEKALLSSSHRMDKALGSICLPVCRTLNESPLSSFFLSYVQDEYDEAT